MPKSFLKAVAWLVACSPAIFSMQGCQTLFRGRTQPVPATSRPVGVMVFVDGTAVGETPVNLKLARRDIHVVRFELAGYRPVEIRITKKRPSLGESIPTNIILAPVGGVVLGPLVRTAWNMIRTAWNPLDSPEGEDDLGRYFESILAGAILGWVGGIVIDSHSPSNFDLSPQTLFVEMEKADGTDAPGVIETDY
ncbi:MAG: PEGA domain-containing protein, partial [Candidatus Aminicenantes bacterium]|nr:PEGA domain-containing protein [Candidatus Aminicenantes bacterium]